MSGRGALLAGGRGCLLLLRFPGGGEQRELRAGKLLAGAAALGFDQFAQHLPRLFLSVQRLLHLRQQFADEALELRRIVGELLRIDGHESSLPA